jgi:hypothetical protein
MVFQNQQVCKILYKDNYLYVKMENHIKIYYDNPNTNNLTLAHSLS